ncbi:MAG: hypothetical protein HFH33_11215 [Eubacterium sp.]|jgi:6-phospho-beta-glucosidase|nr:hypothetical protein [Eubacterium sp.]
MIKKPIPRKNVCQEPAFFITSTSYSLLELGQFQKGVVRAEVVSKTEAELFELYANEELDEKPQQLAMRGGPKPLATGALKLPISGYVQMMKAFERMTVQAAVTGDKNLAVAALNVNPLCPSDALANVVVDELLRVHREYLPQFFA